MGAYLSAPITDKTTFDGDGTYVKFGGSCMQGWRKTMEDAHISECELPGYPDMSLFGVFDGHGGSEVARFCQKYLASELTGMKEFKDGNFEDALACVFHKMDTMLRDSKYLGELEGFKTKEAVEEDANSEDGDAPSPMDALDLLKRVFHLKQMMGENGGQGVNGRQGGENASDPEEIQVQAGCTAVVALRKGNTLFVANAGDSRGVLSRAGRAVALSEDHKPAQEIERNRIIKAGGFLSDVGGVCRVNGNLNLSRAIGDLRYKANFELPPEDQIITAQPDIMPITLTTDDEFFVLACDGVWDVMTNQEVVDYVKAHLAGNLSPSRIASTILDACLAEDPKITRGIGCDNMTCIIVQLKKLSQP